MTPLSRSRRPGAPAGFTLIELLVTLSILGLMMVVLMSVIMTAQRSKSSTINRIESIQAARTAVDVVARDLRSAGYGSDFDYTAQPQPAIAYVDSTQILISANMSPDPDDNDELGEPQAYSPTGNPRPFPLNGTTWEPPIKYRRGAEIIRWTLDVNNDGAIDAGDLADANGLDAGRTQNPDDYVLVRQVYGDSSGGVTGNNGGAIERMALVRSPEDADVPPMFEVYLQGSSTPWDWSLGPVPAARLPDIQRVRVHVRAASARPDFAGNYAETSLRTEVSSMRNTPNLGARLYALDGTVYQDDDGDGTRDMGEVGVPNATVRLGNGMSTVTSATGYYLFRVQAGNYTIRHLAPPGYGINSWPDSVNVVVPPGSTHDWADTLVQGGFVDVFVFTDENQNGTQETGETPVPGINLTLYPSGQQTHSGLDGHASLFASPGAYQVSLTLPDSFACSTPNPASGVMINGGADNLAFGLYSTDVGTITGRVYRDANRNGGMDGGEGGVENVWVGATPDGGLTVVGYDYTDANGEFSMEVPVNDGAGGRPYHVTIIVPNGFFATTSTALGPYTISTGQVVGGLQFGVEGFQVITLNADRVLSLASLDLIEKDWSGSQTQNARKDTDLLLGADAGGSVNVSVWHNRYDSSPLFASTPSHSRLAPQSVLAVALDTLDATTPKNRPDLVTGTKNATAGNFFVWFMQNSPNEGTLPTAYTTGRNYRTANSGDVTAVLTADLIGGIAPDILVGTRGAAAGTGTFELWQSDNATTPAYARMETYAPSGGFSGALGEVTSMQLVDLDWPRDGLKDLVVGTKTGTYSGRILVFRNQGKSGGPSRFLAAQSIDLISAAVTALTVFDVDGDSLQDIVAGIQTSTSAGTIQYYRNITVGTLLDWALDREVPAPGIVSAMTAADLGGATTRRDLLIGWRESESSFVGGTRIFFTDLGTIPTSSTDPSAGNVTHFVPTLTTGNFNWGVKPALPPTPWLPDFAAGVKIDGTTGALVVFIR
jgi:prepilin-type N-terminal cleavage/methylation domain-containing protein